MYAEGEMDKESNSKEQPREDTPAVSLVGASAGHRRNVSADSGLSVSFSCGGKLNESSSQDSEPAGTMMDLSPGSQEELGEGDHAERSIDGKELRTKFSIKSDSGVGSVSDGSMEVEDSESPTSETSRRLRKSGSFDEPEMDTSTRGGALPVGEDSPDCPESVASQAVRYAYSTLVEIFTNQVSIYKFSADLYSSSLIENTVYSSIQSSSDSDDRKTHRILNVVLSKLRLPDSEHNVDSFDCFMEVLRGYPVCCDIAEQIRSKYDNLKQRHRTLRRPDTHDHHSQNEEMVCGEHFRGCMPYSCLKQNYREEQFHIADTAHLVELHTLQRARSISCESESDGAVSLTQEEIEEELKRLHKGYKRVKRFVSKAKGTQGVTEEKLRRTELLVEELQKEIQDKTCELQKCKENKQIIEEQLEIAKRQISLLNLEQVNMRLAKGGCSGSCEHKVECEKLTKRMKKMENEKLDLVATIENLTQQRALLLSYQESER